MKSCVCYLLYYYFPEHTQFLSIWYFLYLTLKMNKWYCIFTETDEITTGAINNLETCWCFTRSAIMFCSWGLWLLPQHNIVSNSRNNWGIKCFLLTISHKLDCKDQILYFSTYARWSGFAVWLELLILFVWFFFFF